MDFIDLFCGMGGFRLGLERTNGIRWDRSSRPQHRGSQEDLLPQEKESSVEKPSDTDFRCVWANDNDHYACQIYRRHFGEISERDIRAVDASAIPDHDLLCAGFPCQSFSIAGKRRGFEDTRGTLFFEICRIIQAKRPRYLFLENVKGLLSHDDGHTFETIIGTLDELGYDCQWQVLNSKDFGVPQNRERVFIIGHLGGQPRPKVFPIGEADEGVVKPELKYVGAIMSEQNQKWLEDDKELSRNFPQGQRVYSAEGIASNICGDAGGLGGKTGLYVVPQRWVRTEKGKQARRESKGKGRDYTPFNEGHRELVASKEDITGCVTGALAKDALLGNAQRIRRLTPLECERLQGFPDGWTEGISDTQRYKCLGNAVTVNVIEAIGRQWVMGL